jgi:hypothetical protein
MLAVYSELRVISIDVNSALSNPLHNVASEAETRQKMAKNRNLPVGK